MNSPTGGTCAKWIVAQGRVPATRQALLAHFAENDREDGTFHAGVLTALEGMAVYPNEHRLKRSAGLFNDDGFWDPQDYIDLERPPSGTDPFAQLVLAMKQALMASVKTIRDDAQVNRDNLSAVVEPAGALDQPVGAIGIVHSGRRGRAGAGRPESTPVMALIRPSTARHRSSPEASRTVFDEPTRSRWSGPGGTQGRRKSPEPCTSLRSRERVSIPVRWPSP